jgi:hypothetical protein
MMINKRSHVGVLVAVAATVLLSGCAGSGAEPRAASTSTAAATSSKSATPKPTAATVPALKGLTMTQVRRKLRAAGLKVGKIQRKPSNAKSGTLLSQGVKSGTKLEAGSGVSVTFAISLPRVPSVVGQSASSAVRELSGAGFRVVETRQTTNSGRNGVVLSQSPGSVRARPAAVITIVVSHVVHPATTQSNNCTPGYSPCLPPASDYDCAGGSGNGPEYADGPIAVTGSDPYGLDADGDGVGCES